MGRRIIHIRPSLLALRPRRPSQRFRYDAEDNLSVGDQAVYRCRSRAKNLWPIKPDGKVVNNDLAKKRSRLEWSRIRRHYSDVLRSFSMDTRNVYPLNFFSSVPS